MPMPTFPNHAQTGNGMHYMSDCGEPCCGRPCPGPAPGTRRGGWLWASSGCTTATSRAGGDIAGIEAADAHCLAEAEGKGLVAKDGPPAELKRHEALLADEAG